MWDFHIDRELIPILTTRSLTVVSLVGIPTKGMETNLPSMKAKIEDSIIQAPFYRELVFFDEANRLFYFLRLLMIEVGLILGILVSTFIISAPICILRPLREFMSGGICVECLLEDIDTSYIIFIHLIISYLNPQTSY